MNVYIYTLGCRLNQCESEALADAFSKEGHTVLPSFRGADLVIVNSCTVTSKAEQKARRMIRIFAKEAAVIVTGCYAEVNPDEIRKLGERMHIFGLKQKASLLDLPSYLSSALLSLSLDDAISSFKASEKSPFDFDAHSFSYHSRAYLKIQDGCDNSCGYCRTTVARGPSVSLDSSIVVERALRLEAEGFHEIMLTGVNLTMYDHEGEGLGGLAEKLLAELGSGIRLRLSSMEPDHVDDRLLDAIADYRFQPHFHIPIQSASQRVLDRVGRRYSIEHVSYIIERLREIKDDPFIACDVIAGLPAEGDAEFEETYSFLASRGFAAMHVFPYSPRPSTALYGAKDRPEERVRDERAERLRKLSASQSHEYIARQLGKRCEVLVERVDGGNAEGTTGNYLKARVEGKDLRTGGLYRGVFTSVFPLVVTVDQD